jgi:oligoribonuclease NrnB/cAMP/cGMP phosphodiesterase (DHH superfamily)
MDIYNMTHASDLDGISSAAMLVGTYKVPLSNIYFADYTEERFQYNLLRIRRDAPKDSVFIISDLSIGNSQSRQFFALLRYLKGRNNKIVWIDHHVWDGKVINAAAKFCDLMVVGENARNCAAELVYRILCDSSRRYSDLASIAHISDFKLFELVGGAKVRKMAMGISGIVGGKAIKKTDSMLRKVVSAFSRCDYFPEVLAASYRQYLKEAKLGLGRLSKNIFCIEYKDMRVGVGFSTGLNSNEACDYIFEKEKCNLAIFVNTSKYTAHLRRSEGIDCARLARHFGGGGHPYAAGFEMSKKAFGEFTEAKMTAFVEIVRNALAEIY